MSLILGIETSCDETACAVVRDGVHALSNVIASQHELHAAFGGVVPEIASRAHVERLTPTLRAALAEAGVALRDLDAIAVGHRPGLIGSLLVGVAAAKALAWSLGRPLIGVDHVEAHLYSSALRAHKGIKGPRDQGIEWTNAYPALGLVVSGGHTSMYRCDSPLASSRLGSTIDDAVGEAYDKVAMILGLGHAGGPRVDALARAGDDRAHDFPISRLAPESLDFSFSGLKTAVLYAVRGVPTGRADAPFTRDHAALSDKEKADIAASFQRAACRAIILKMERALDQWRGEACRTILIGGGVSANSRLRADLLAFASAKGLGLGLPQMNFCTDNAAMIAGLAHHRLVAGAVDDLSLQAEPTPAR